MIISRTPFRISFFGGGTDYPVWYKKRRGAVLSTSIDKYCYLTCRFLPPFFEHKSRVVWSFIEKVKHPHEIKHPSAREVIKFLKINKGLEIHHDADLPARSGLGSSSSFTVGLLHSLHALHGRKPTKRQLALEAIHIEQNLIKESVGAQDQVAAAYGGLNRIEFGGPNHITVKPLVGIKNVADILNTHIMLFFTGFSRFASDIAAAQIRSTPRKEKELDKMFGMVGQAEKLLRQNNARDFGKLLDESWQVKRTLTGKITNGTIDDIYETGVEAGALGGKLLGAGGGGFIMFFVEPKNQSRVKDRLKKLLYVPVKIEDKGSHIIFNGSQGLH